jgi:excinuclease UvrABC nuclease subunit
MTHTDAWYSINEIARKHLQRFAETIDLGTLPSIKAYTGERWRRNLPMSCGVYFFKVRGSLQYIGSSVDIRRRWAEHYFPLVGPEDQANIAWILLEDPQALIIEHYCIAHFKPELNCIYNRSDSDASAIAEWHDHFTEQPKIDRGRLVQGSFF